ncbi:MAG TPA: endo-beta-N-acetylglucosaminidase [Cellvibrio sp.]|nr:endo-beta-N-acetylglucosaminidase [Cellvibrio sp.]
MNKNASQWLLGFLLVAFPLATLVLVLALATIPAQQLFIDRDVDQDELTSNTLLPDFGAIDQTPERKAQFLDMLRPLIAEKNAKLLKSRERLVKIKAEWDASQTISGVNKRNLAKLREKFHVTYETYPDDSKAVEILLLRVDAIPPAMVMAQAAIESGWGTSRFAEEAHNLFGHWCYKEGCGIVPSKRPTGAKHEVKKFNNVEESITAYFNNINTHNAYRPWRQLRAQLRDTPQQFTGSAMVAELGKYSARGSAYIHELRTVIRGNNLE